MNAIANTLVTLLVGVAIGIGGAIGFCYLDRVAKPIATATLAPPAEKFKKSEAKKETKSCESVQALPSKSKKELALPAVVQRNESIDVIATADVPREDRPFIASALLDRSTGEGQIAFTPMPRPWIDVGNRYEVGLAWLPLNEGDTGMLRIDGRVEMLRLKALHVGLVGAVSEQDGKYRKEGGVRGWVGWR